MVKLERGGDGDADGLDSRLRIVEIIGHIVARLVRGN